MNEDALRNALKEAVRDEPPLSFDPTTLTAGRPGPRPVRPLAAACLVLLLLVGVGIAVTSPASAPPVLLAGGTWRPDIPPLVIDSLEANARERRLREAMAAYLPRADDQALRWDYSVVDSGRDLISLRGFTSLRRDVLVWAPGAGVDGPSRLCAWVARCEIRTADGGRVVLLLVVEFGGYAQRFAYDFRSDGSVVAVGTARDHPEYTDAQLLAIATDPAIRA